MLLAALKEGGLQWAVICMKHNKRHDEGSDPWPGTNQFGSMHTETGKEIQQDCKKYYNAM